MEKSRFLVMGAVHVFLELPLWTVMLYSQLLYLSETCDPWVTVYQAKQATVRCIMGSVKEANKKDFDLLCNFRLIWNNYY